MRRFTDNLMNCLASINKKIKLNDKADDIING